MKSQINVRRGRSMPSITAPEIDQTTMTAPPAPRRELAKAAIDAPSVPAKERGKLSDFEIELMAAWAED